MAQAVNQLERTGYAGRRPNPRDHRSQPVFLTERGASVPPVTHAVTERVEESWAQLDKPAEFEALCSSLLRLLAGLRDSKPATRDRCPRQPVAHQRLRWAARECSCQIVDYSYRDRIVFS